MAGVSRPPLFVAEPLGSQSYRANAGEIWVYSALIIGLALIGAVLTFQSENRNHAALLGGLCFGAFMITQFYDETLPTIDMHLAYGIWFAAIAAGYACGKFIQGFPEAEGNLQCSAVRWPSLTQLRQAGSQHGNATTHGPMQAYSSAISSCRRTQGAIYVPAQEANIAKYYTPQGSDWTQWSEALSLDPVGTTGRTAELLCNTPAEWELRTYSALLHHDFLDRRLPGKCSCPHKILIAIIKRCWS